jgi:PAS domain S-box-containing protein
MPLPRWWWLPPFQSVSCCVRLAIQPPICFFYTAILFALWFGELGPGLLATLLSALAVNYFLYVPYNRLSLGPADIFRTVFFCASVGTMCWFVDNHRKRAEMAEEALAQSREDLLASQDQLAKIINSAMDAIITLDQDQRIVVFNAAAEKIFGCPKSAVLGHPIDHFIPDPLREIHRSHIRHFAGTGVSSRSMYSPRTLTGLRANGEEFPLEATISQVTARGRKLCTVILRDITVRKKTEAALIRSEKLATVGRVAATIAHEINNPLQAVSDLLYLARVSPANSSEYLLMAAAELARAAQITNATLGFTRGGGKITRFRPSDVLESILTLFDRKLKSKSVVCERDYLTETEISGVESEIRQVLWNLLNNSLDAVEQGGCIKLRVSSSLHAVNGPGVRITVADNGHGIATPSAGILFEPFFTTKENGNGLGLWVVSELVKKHRGSIRVRSRTTPGSPTGTAFCVFLPAESREKRNSPASAVMDEDLAAQNKLA